VLVRTLRYAMERKQAERQLRISEARFKAFMDNSPAIAWMKGEDGRYSYVNASWQRFFQRRLEDVQGKTDLDLWPRMIAEHKRETDQRVLATRRSLQFSEMLPDFSGTLRTWLTYKFPLQDTNGRSRIVGGMAMDLTEQERAKEALRDSEERYRRLVEVSPDAIFITKENEVAFINEAGCACSVRGMRSRSRVGRSSISSASTIGSWRRRLSDLVNRRRSFDFFEERVSCTADGERVDAEVAVVPLIDRGVPAMQVVLHEHHGAQAC
jgi:PAS domain S-box-containing protein